MTDLFAFYDVSTQQAPPNLVEPEVPDLDAASTIIVAFSGGKDSVACVLHLLELGVPRDRIELWHHDIDGRESAAFMDWPITPDYCRAFARELGMKIFFSWKEGGFEREMLRENASTAPIWYETPEGDIRKVGGESNKLNTRRLFPQAAASLTTRWCSAYLKVDVGAASLRNQERFINEYTIFITGERAEESASRAKYKTLEPHRTDQRNGTRRPRKVDHWRPVHAWTEQQVWDALQRHGIRPHPVYDTGIGRCSCAFCIFASPSQTKTAAEAAPAMMTKIANYEREFGKTIHRTKTIEQRAAEGSLSPAATKSALARCMKKIFDEPILIDPADWKLPAGAYGENDGPI